MDEAARREGGLSGARGPCGGEEAAMPPALIRAIEELFTPPLRRGVVLSLALAVASFATLWIGIAILVHNTALFGWWPLDWLIDLFGALAILLLSWLLFPAVVTIVAGFFLARVAAPVEARDYFGLDPPRGAQRYYHGYLPVDAADGHFKPAGAAALSAIAGD